MELTIDQKSAMNETRSNIIMHGGVIFYIALYTIHGVDIKCIAISS